MLLAQMMRYRAPSRTHAHSLWERSRACVVTLNHTRSDACRRQRAAQRFDPFVTGPRHDTADARIFCQMHMQIMGAPIEKAYALVRYCSAVRQIITRQCVRTCVRNILMKATAIINCIHPDDVSPHAHVKDTHAHAHRRTHARTTIRPFRPAGSPGFIVQSPLYLTCVLVCVCVCLNAECNCSRHSSATKRECLTFTTHTHTKHTTDSETRAPLPPNRWDSSVPSRVTRRTLSKGRRSQVTLYGIFKLSSTHSNTYLYFTDFMISSWILETIFNSNQRVVC